MSHQGGRHQAEQRDRRIAAADVRRVHEDLEKPLLLRPPMQGGALVGDRHESFGPPRDGGVFEALAEVCRHGVRFNRAT